MAVLIVTAQGYKREYGKDYEETFAPAAKMTSVRALLRVAGSLELALMDDGSKECISTWSSSRNNIHATVSRTCMSSKTCMSSQEILMC